MEPMGADAGPKPVEVAFAGPGPQRRLTVAFRILLLIPHAVVLFFVAIATYVVVIAAWFVALVLGRLPEGMAGFIEGVMRYVTRVYAYAYLLTDRYPPFSFAPADYPVAVTAHPGRLNRLAVLFRLILMIPAYIVVGLLGYGLGVAVFFVWLIVLVAGRMPASLHQAIASVVRYETRYYAYSALISSAYPAGLFGDRATRLEPVQDMYGASPVVPPSETPVVPPPAPATPSEPASAEMPPTEPGFGGTSPATWPPPTPPSFMAPPAASAPLASRLVLTPAAKRIIALFLALGVLGSAGSIALSVVAASSAGNLQAFNNLSDDYSQLTQEVSQFQTQANGCSTGGGLPCIQTAARNLSGGFAVFAQQVQGLNVPASDQDDANRLVSDSQQVSSLLARMAAAANQQDYLSLANQFQSLGDTFDRDYQTLGQDLLT